MPKVWRIVDLIQWSESYFRDKSHQNPRLEIEWMLRSLLNCERLDLYMRFDEPLSGSQLSTLRGWVKDDQKMNLFNICLLFPSPSPRDGLLTRIAASA